MITSESKKSFSLINILVLLPLGLFWILIKIIKHLPGNNSSVNKTFTKKGSVPKSMKKTSVKVLDTKIEGLNERQEKIITKLQEQGRITPKELQKLIPGVSTRTLRRDMDSLASKKLVSQKGTTKSTYYIYIG